MWIVMLILSLIGTVATVIITLYASYITSQVSGERLLTINSELGYKYATTYHNWQLAAVVTVVMAVALWIIFVLLMIKRHKKSKQKLAS
jgi:ABC-type spermidine/putrescine transport system permease subunit I